MKKRILSLPLALACLVTATHGATPRARTDVSTVQTTPEALQVEDMTEAELRQRLSEYEAGKRNYRDGYIILNQLWFNYQARKQTDEPEYQKINTKREDLLKKYPNLNSLQDFRLSDRIQFEKLEKDRRARAKQEAAAWQPSDNVPVRLILDGKKAIAVFQFKLGFYESSTVLSSLPKVRPGASPRISSGGQEISLDKLRLKKTEIFRHRLKLAPDQPKSAPAVLICTSALGSQYTGMTPDEDAKIAQKGFRHGSMPWENDAAARGHFCGIFASSGEILVEFPATFTPTKTAWEPIGISDDGKRAAIAIGKLRMLRAEEESYLHPGSPWEVWTWASGATKKQIIQDASEHDLRRRFFLKTL